MRKIAKNFRKSVNYSAWKELRRRVCREHAINLDDLSESFNAAVTTETRDFINLVTEQCRPRITYAASADLISLCIAAKLSLLSPT